MNLDQLRYVKEIVETQSMSLAAHNLYMTQSAISQSVAQLEQELGVTLFKRSRNGTFPTKEGQKIIQKCLELLDKEQELYNESRMLQTPFSGELKIAASPSILLTFLLQALQQFAKDFPNVLVTVQEQEKGFVVKRVQQKEDDLGMLMLFEPEETFPDHLQVYPFHREGRFMVIVSNNSSLAFRETIALEELIHYPYILFDRHFFNELITSIETDEQKVRIVLRSKNTEFIKRAVAENLGVSIVTSVMLENDPYIETNKIKAIPLTGTPINYSLTSYATYDANNGKRALIEKFLSYVDA